MSFFAQNVADVVHSLRSIIFRTFLLKNCEKKLAGIILAGFFSEPLFRVCSEGFLRLQNMNVDKSVKNLMGET